MKSSRARWPSSASRFGDLLIPSCPSSPLPTVDAAPLALQVSLQLLDLTCRAVGEHADRAHTDHDLAGGWMLWQLRSNPRRGRCQRPSATGLTAGYAQNLWIGA